MEFKEALKEILKIKGSSALEDESTLKFLEGYGAFEEYPVFKSIMNNIIAMKIGKMLQNTFYYSVEDKGQGWGQMKDQLSKGLPYDKIFLDLFLDAIEYAFMGYAYEKGASERNFNSEVEEMLGQVWTDNKRCKYSSDKEKLINGSEVEGAYIVNPETKYIDSYAFQQNSRIERITFPKKLDKIGSHAFQNCSYLNTVDFKDDVSEIFEFAFGGCASLKEVYLPNGLHMISDGLFSVCTNLLYVHIPQSVTHIGANAFSDCHSLQYVVIPDNVTSIGDYAFNWCKSLYYVVLPSKLRSVGEDVFNNCKKLRYIGIPEGTKSKYTNLMPRYAYLFIEYNKKELEDKEIVKKETLSSCHGKENVTHIVLNNGTECWLTQERSFEDEANANGACKLNTVENEKKHVLFLFNSNDEEVGRYYIGKKLQGKSPEQLVEMKEKLAFFDSWNPEQAKWVPCVGVMSNSLKEIGSKAVSFKSNNLIQNRVNDFSITIKETIRPQVTEHLGNAINREVKTTGHLLFLQQLVNNSLYIFKHPSDNSDLPSFMWNDEGLSMGYDSILPYTIPFLWIRTLAKRNVEKFDEVMNLLIKEFGVEVSEKIEVAVIIQGIKQYGFCEFKPNFDVQVNKSILSTFYGDCLSLENFILLIGSNIDMSEILPSMDNKVNISDVSLSLNKIINEMVDDFRRGNIEGN